MENGHLNGGCLRIARLCGEEHLFALGQFESFREHELSAEHLARLHARPEIVRRRLCAQRLLLAQLDHYEGTAEPGNPFGRVPIKVRLDRGGMVDAWTYEVRQLPERRSLIESGDFILHRRLREQRRSRP